jgi:hypothetical protein
MTITIELPQEIFTLCEKSIVSFDVFKVSAFRYPSGVAAVRIRNDRGEIIALPFQGQQIWRAGFDGHDLTMKSMFAEPVVTRNYLENYGAFYLHCGLTAVGPPGPEDSHGLHGELPNAPFQRAWLEVYDSGVSIRGSYEYAMAFAAHYEATTSAMLHRGSALIDVGIRVKNLRRAPMQLMYLGHANFRPVDNGELDYSASYDPDSVRVRRSIPAHINPPPGYAELLQRLADKPEIHHRLIPAQAYDPEVVFQIGFQAGKNGKAYSRQIHPDGGMDYIEFDPVVFPNSLRWICRTPDQDALGMALPSTSGGGGQRAEIQGGRYIPLDGGGSWEATVRLGRLQQNEWPIS